MDIGREDVRFQYVPTRVVRGIELAAHEVERCFVRDAAARALFKRGFLNGRLPIATDAERELIVDKFEVLNPMRRREAFIVVSERQNKT